MILSPDETFDKVLVEIRISGAGNKWHLVSGKTQEMQMQEKHSSALFFKYSGKGAIAFNAFELRKE